MITLDNHNDVFTSVLLPCDPDASDPREIACSVSYREAVSAVFADAALHGGIVRRYRGVDNVDRYFELSNGDSYTIYPADHALSD